MLLTGMLSPHASPRAPPPPRSNRGAHQETRVNEKLLAWKALSDQMPDIAAASKAVLRAWKRHCNIGKKQPGAAP